MQAINLKAAEEYVKANYPNDPLLKHIAVTLLEQLPKVETEEVTHSEWKYGVRAAICKNCGFERHLDDDFGRAIACPNCGAKMDGGCNGSN